MYENLKKKFGQNFLIDKNILNKIYKLIPSNGLKILEIGPGSGNLTSYILKSNPSQLTIVEIDNDLINLLNKKFSKNNIVKIIEGDILKNNLIINQGFDLILSNLPYNISSQILINLCLIEGRPKKMILMFQKEFANRLIDKKLNSINSIINVFYKIEKKFDISNNSFYPIPKVKSTILEFNRLDNPLLNEYEINNYIIFKREIFNKKRKSLGSILNKYRHLKLIEDFSTKRAENLTQAEFLNLYLTINP